VIETGLPINIWPEKNGCSKGKRTQSSSKINHLRTLT